MMYETVRRLAERGHKMDVYHFNNSDDSYLPLRPLVQYSISYPFKNRQLNTLRSINPKHRWTKLLAKIQKKKYEGEELFFTNLVEFFLNLYSFDRTCNRMAREIDSKYYDIVFIQPFLGYGSPNLLRHLRTPSVFMCQESFRQVTEFFPRKHKSYIWRINAGTNFKRSDQIRAILMRYNDAGNVRAASHVLANSYYSRESLYRWYNIDASVLPMGVDTGLFRPMGLPREKFVLAVGSIAQHKAHDFCVEALAHIPIERRPNLILVGTVGVKEEFEFLEKRADELGVGLTIKVNIADEMLVDLYNRASLTLCASIMEPLGLTSLESQACGTPVVAVAEGGFRETVIDGVTGLMVDRDTNKFAQAISYLLDNKPLCQTMGQRGREEVEKKWTWDRTIVSLEEIFARTLASRNQLASARAREK